MRTFALGLLLICTVVFCAMAQPLPEASKAPASGQASKSSSSTSTSTTAATQKVELKLLYKPGTYETVLTSTNESSGQGKTTAESKIWDTLVVGSPDSQGHKQFLHFIKRQTWHNVSEDTDGKKTQTDVDTDQPAGPNEPTGVALTRARVGIKLSAKMSADGEIVEAQYIDIPKDLPEIAKHSYTQDMAKHNAKQMMNRLMLPDKAVVVGDTYEHMTENNIEGIRLKTRVKSEVLGIGPIRGGHLVTIRSDYSTEFEARDDGNRPRFVPENRKSTFMYTFDTTLGCIVKTESWGENSSRIQDKAEDRTILNKSRFISETRYVNASTTTATAPGN